MFMYDGLMKTARSYLPATEAALVALGAQVAAARRELGWTAAELGERVGASAALVSRIERGAPGTAIGTVFEAAIVCGVPLFGVGSRDLGDVAARERDRLALLPRHVHQRSVEVDDDF
jgi:transcriptional regulator with XRE-family HTH domain